MCRRARARGSKSGCRNAARAHGRVIGIDRMEKDSIACKAPCSVLRHHPPQSCPISAIIPPIFAMFHVQSLKSVILFVSRGAPSSRLTGQHRHLRDSTQHGPVFQFPRMTIGSSHRSAGSSALRPTQTLQLACGLACAKWLSCGCAGPSDITCRTISFIIL
jgi:hypothetical protein